MNCSSDFNESEARRFSKLVLLKETACIGNNIKTCIEIIKKCKLVSGISIDKWVSLQH